MVKGTRMEAHVAGVSTRSQPVSGGAALSGASTVIRRIVAERHDRPSLVATIACEIGAEIIDGSVQPGDDLNSVDLSRRFATSRTPIREALMLLEKEGLVEIPARRRPRVRLLEFAEVRDIYEARSALFALMGRSVARNADDPEIASLLDMLSVLRRCHEQRDREGYLWANVEFFDRITLLARNRTIRAILDSLLLRTLPLRRLSLSLPDRMARSLDDAERLVRAFQQREADLAAALIRSNHLNALKALAKYFDQAAARWPVTLEAEE